MPLKNIPTNKDGFQSVMGASLLLHRKVDLKNRTAEKFEKDGKSKRKRFLERWKG